MTCQGCASTLTDGEPFCWPCRDRNRHREFLPTDIAALTKLTLRKLATWQTNGLLPPSLGVEPPRYSWADAMKASALHSLQVEGVHTLSLVRVLSDVPADRFVSADALVFNTKAPALLCTSSVSGYRRRHRGEDFLVVQLSPIARALDARSRQTWGDRHPDEILAQRLAEAGGKVWWAR